MSGEYNIYYTEPGANTTPHLAWNVSYVRPDEHGARATFEPLPLDELNDPDFEPSAEWHETMRLRQELREFGVARTTDQALGFDERFRRRLLDDYFDTAAVRRHDGDRPSDRERARDVLVYERGDDIALDEAPDTSYERMDAAGDSYRQTYERIKTLDDPELTAFLGSLLHSIPEEAELLITRAGHLPASRMLGLLCIEAPLVETDALLDTVGTMGVNFLRTHSSIVGGPHHDDAKFIMIYVVDKQGAGAANSLIQETGLSNYTDGLPTGPAGHRTDMPLAPGDILLFSDDMYKHDVTALTTTPAYPSPRRDVLVCTVDIPGTYDLSYRGLPA